MPSPAYSLIVLKAESVKKGHSESIRLHQSWKKLTLFSIEWYGYSSNYVRNSNINVFIYIVCKMACYRNKFSNKLVKTICLAFEINTTNPLTGPSDILCNVGVEFERIKEVYLCLFDFG